MASRPSNQYLIDVRTAAEFSTGSLPNAINLEYQLIDQLPSVLAELGFEVRKSDAITLYCRSGWRSAVALQGLKNLGYENARDIGGLEEARAVLKREEAMRGLPVRKEQKVEMEVIENDGKKYLREKSLKKLLDSLKELE
ncbi:hypothetical protein CC78DRAFT_307393 [Lojkania enalia]|uniref:Rhodanese domain-containing protein n=1 Tax=Lojkania enalia TaxID=147567 RepID=A0A9P4N9T6_9PLEO|nr:hypothetical protein CC78DRAFT_307393 [Didymosphaeria enalia]